MSADGWVTRGPDVRNGGRERIGDEGLDQRLTMLTDQPETPLGKIDDDLVVFSFPAVVLGQLLPQPSHLDADSGVMLGIIRGRLAEAFDGNDVFL